MSLFGIIIMSVVNIFIGSSTLMYVISFVSVLVFGTDGLRYSGAQRIHESAVLARCMKRSILGALKLYLDLINLFLSLCGFSAGR